MQDCYIKYIIACFLHSFCCCPNLLLEKQPCTCAEVQQELLAATLSVPTFTLLQAYRKHFGGNTLCAQHITTPCRDHAQLRSCMPALQEDVGPLDDSVPVHYYPEGEATEAASAAVAIDASNKGFQLLQKMGWRGKGLGRKENGA
jgi:hypothetical protein